MVTVYNVIKPRFLGVRNSITVLGIVGMGKGMKKHVWGEMEGGQCPGSANEDGGEGHGIDFTGRLRTLFL